MKGKFVEGEQRTVPAHANEKALDVILPSALDYKYDVEKLSTSGLPTEYNGYQIVWVNNFKLKLKPGKSKKNVKVEYEVQFDKPNIGGKPDELLFIHDGAIHMVDSADWSDLGNGKVAARLKGDDPAMGWGGK
jgi:hypothetical protein